jgi:hypothetical protein
MAHQMTGVPFGIPVLIIELRLEVRKQSKLCSCLQVLDEAGELLGMSEGWQDEPRQEK